jgi:hypothetical protein
MATASLEAANLFNVKGLVAVITGGGSGKLSVRNVPLYRFKEQQH